MDERIFERLDMLERDATSNRGMPQRAYNDSSGDFSPYDAPDPMYGQWQDYSQPAPLPESEFDEQPMVLDAFDEQLLRQPDYNSRHGQAILGQARLSLPPAPSQAASRDVPYKALITEIPNMHSGTRTFNLSHFAYGSGQHDPSSSSPNRQQMPSSPAFSANQRRPAPIEDAGSACPASHTSLRKGPERRNTYQLPFEDDLAQETRRMQTQELGPFNSIESRPNPVAAPKPHRSNGDPPVVQGINLVSTQTLPDRFRAIFSFSLFNAVQSKCFETIYKTNNNFVLSAPTGSGKTAVMELAICRLINSYAHDSYKIVYQAPTKSLCAERQRDWQMKFAALDLVCAELTGDTDNAQLRNVQHANIIITTPEKWDSITRKWKDHQKLMQMVKLFLIDEVHILKEDRGATLEAVVSRMKSVGSSVRFVALSATVPNSQDIAAWLGKDSNNPETPATREKFGEEFRPVRLQKHVCGYATNSNDYGFDKTLNAKLPEVISKWSERKPLMVFCFTRAACVETAKSLTNWWTTKGPRDRYWTAPRKSIDVAEKDLRETVSSGVAFHHAGLTPQDRATVEQGYLDGNIQVICCTSTLAVGVNLPCHMVIIKNTVSYQSTGCKEYSDLEVMQMLGRAGRPQFDNSAVAVIMTRLPRVPYYEKMISGQEVLESCLHRNLIDHLNAEIGLGTINSVAGAKAWLTGTFLFVRIRENPTHYKIEGDTPGCTLDKRLENICRKGIALLGEHDLIKTTSQLQCTEFGDAMARYYLQFDTMKIFLALPGKAKISEILSSIAQAAEFKEVRFRAGERTTYKDMNKNGSIKFPIPVNLDAPAHKVSLVIQSVLGSVDFPSTDYKQQQEYNSSKALIFQHAHRLIRCIIDCQLFLEDAVTTRNALMLARSLGSRVWDDSPLHMKQLDSVGIQYVRRLVAAGIKSIDELETVEAHQIERALSRNPPYGSELQKKAKAFPKPFVSIKIKGEPQVKKGEHVKIDLEAKIGFTNDKVPEVFQRKPVYVCLLAETSDGQKVHFARISAKRLGQGQDVLFSAILTSPTQWIRAFVMCDEIAGTLRQAHCKPSVPPSAFPTQKNAEETAPCKRPTTSAANTSKRRASTGGSKKPSHFVNDVFGDDDIDESDLVRAEAEDFVDIDDFDEPDKDMEQPSKKKRKITAETPNVEDWEPERLASGKWKCNHPCKDKTKCKHLCCREGLDKKPKPPKPKENKKQRESGSELKQMQLDMSVSKKSNKSKDLPPKDKATTSLPKHPQTTKEMTELNRLHSNVKSKTPTVPTFAQNRSKDETASSTVQNSQTRPSFLKPKSKTEKMNTSDYGSDSWQSYELPDMSELLHYGSLPREESQRDDDNGATDDEMLDDAEDEDPFDSFGDGLVDLSSFSGGDKNSQTPFQLDESMNEAVGLPPSDPAQATIAANTGSADDISEAGASGMILQQNKHKAERRTGRTQEGSPLQNPVSRGSSKLDEESAALDPDFNADDFLADINVLEAQAEEREEAATKSPSPDDLQKWFEREFGTEGYQFVE